jgi:hypothetical protein
VEPQKPIIGIEPRKQVNISKGSAEAKAERLSRSTTATVCPREANLPAWFRKPALYPLSYGERGKGAGGTLADPVAIVAELPEHPIEE